MKPGEQRTVRSFQPILNQVRDVHLQAFDYEETKLLETSRRLLKVQVSIPFDTGTIEEIRWADDTGQTLKVAIPGLGHVAYRTKKEVALAKADEFDLALSFVVPVSGSLPNAQKLLIQATIKPT